ncbi:MAG TPA: (4Fe-4S)-binding protein, partial [Actinocrinis sp.]|nr:(4Fe-4S)-binding protein [Actinocrinis sp.]
MPSFPEAARVSTKDARLRANLTRATHTIRARREQAVAELADWAELRAAGAAIKERTLRHLDTYLLQLEEK